MQTFPTGVKIKKDEADMKIEKTLSIKSTVSEEKGHQHIYLGNSRLSHHLIQICDTWPQEPKYTLDFHDISMTSKMQN